MACVLLIDDDRTGLLVRACVLRAAGYSVLTAETGFAGLELAAHACVDVVVLDYTLPDMNGSEALQCIRAIRPAVPILFLSGLVDLPEDDRSAANDVLVKGEGPQRLLAAIAQHAPLHMAA